MNNNYLLKKLAGIIFILFACFNTSNAQVGRIPTKEEIAIKKNLENIYRSSPNKALSNPANHLMVTGPEQDCDNSIPVCQQSYSQSNSYTGNGSTQEVSGTCLSSQETNSVWYTFTVQNSGTFTFMLNTANDYDFALYDITTIGCAGVPSATPVRCNFSATYGNTGLTLPASATIPISESASGPPTMAGLNVTAGQTFALIIDNYSANSNGYTLTFGGTAQIFDNVPPTFGTLTHACNSNSLNLTFSEPVQCSSIATNGSDFTITGPGALNVPVISASGNLCSTGASFTSFATLNFNSTGLPSGTYTVSLNTGTDGNTILDKCGNSMSTSQSATFILFAPISISASDSIVCTGGASTLTISGVSGLSGVTYSWAPIAGTYDSLNVNPASTNTYVATATYGGCSQSVSLAITVSQPPVVFVNPGNVSLCSGTTNLVASATMNGSPCTNCDYVWSGSSTQTDNGVPSSTIAGAGAGTYNVTVSSNTGCLGNTATSTVSILSPTSPPSCDIIYVSPAGGGSGLIPTAPTTIQTALTMAACNSIVIKMQIGDYTISNPLSATSFITIEGGYNVGFTLKTSAKATAGGFPVQGTRIIRNTSNVEGSAGNLRLTAFNITAGSSYFRFQDLRIDMPDNAAGSAISNYGIYLGNGCSEYNIVRCYIYSGNAGSGTSGAAGTVGAIGSTGGPGGAGGNGWSGTMGDGGYEGGGAGSTHASMFWDFAGGASNGTSTIAAEAANGGTRNGGEGGAGGSGGYYDEDGGNGSSGGAGGNGAAGGIPPANSGGWWDCGWYSSMEGFNGNPGAVGGIGTIGAVGPAGSDATGYWFTGSQGGNGGNGYGGGGGSGAGGGGGDGGGFCFNSNGTGGGGGGGGGGGQGGTGGTGGTGGGSTYGIFIFNNGANSNVTDCQILNGLAGAGGTGGVGGTGGNGGNGGARGCADACTGSGEGNGGTGGAGGKGGTGGTGGTGSAGLAVQVKLVGGVALVQNTSLNMLTQPVITVDNIACTNISINHNTTAGAPSWTDFGSGASPASGAGSPAATQYSSLGRKDIVMNANPYSGFNNIIVNPPSTGTILASTTSLCPGAAQFAASAVGTPGFSYLWSVLPVATIATPTLDNTSITFSNTGSTAITYTVTLTISSTCCGPLAPITQTVTVNPIPAAPTATVTPVCLGGAATFTATAPSGSSFSWYDAAVSGTLLGSGTTYTTANLLTTSAYTVYLQATNSDGCSSTITPVSVTPTAIQAPAPVSVTSCDTGIVFVNINPVAGVTNYNWYSDIAGTILMQSGSSLSYGQNIGSLGGTYTIYVQSDVAGCTPSSLVALTGNVSANPITLSQSFLPNDTVCINTPVTVTLTPSGGDGTYTYSWSPIVSSSNTITQTLTASTAYYVTISSDGCSKLFNLPIIVKPYPFDSIAPTSGLTCTALTITLDGSSSDAGPDISYAWSTSGGNITSGINSNIATADAAGTYTLTVTDNSSGCSSIDSVTVNSNNVPPVVTASGNNNISCITTSAILTGNSSGNTIVWNGGILVNAANPATVSAAGTYTVTVTDSANGCTTIDSVTITGNTTPPTVSTSSNNNISCITPSAILTGTSTGNTIVWNGGVLINEPNPATVTTAGTYTLTVTDAVNGCINTDSITITGNTTPPTLTASGNNNITCSTPSSTLTGNSAGSTMVWNGGALTNAPDPATVTAAGTYTVTATDGANGCTSTDSVTITANTTLPTVTATSNNNISCTTPIATLTGTSAGNAMVWNGGTLVNAADPATVTTGGTYVVTATDAVNGCTNTATVIVTSNTTPPDVNAGLDTTLNCVITSLNLNGSSTTAGVNYSWSGPGIVSGSTTSTPTINSAGLYTLTITDPSNGCTATDNISVTNTPFPIASFTANPLTGVPPLTVNFTNGSQNANTYSWTFGNNQSSTLTDPSDIYTAPGTYTVVLIASYNNQCPDTAEFVITIFDDYFLMIPNIFTPDGDGTNDLFFVTSTGVENIEASIYDRWGLKLYEWNAVNGGWNGRTNAGIASPSGTYYYLIKVKPLDPAKEEEVHNGYLQLIRN
ncbi:MAG: hypothetical protein A3F72_01045 [Bacteroidetes bacterium RIFCSPLOWO2_12_FULL_35_15]|nr:MAG: hypothetical protein A3F72_01045 [Bacteroidetes bacterium RIFCSPLOWO2_12_FULL_35_15]